MTGEWAGRRLATVAPAALAVLAVLAVSACTDDHPAQTQPLPTCAALGDRISAGALKQAVNRFPHAKDVVPTDPDFVPPTSMLCAFKGMATDGSTPVLVRISLDRAEDHTSPGMVAFGQKALQRAKGDCGLIGTWSTTEVPVSIGRCFRKYGEGTAEQTTVHGPMVISVRIDVNPLATSKRGPDANQQMLQDQAQWITDSVAAAL